MKILDYIKIKKQSQNDKTKKFKLTDITPLSPDDQINNMDKIRLVYSNLNLVDIGYKSKTGIGVELFMSEPYLLPKDMTKEEAFKLISYLHEENERLFDLKQDSKESVYAVAEQLKNLGFLEIRVTENNNFSYTQSVPKIGKPLHVDKYYEIDGVTDLVTVNGDMKLFDKSNIATNYFEWFVPGVTKEELMSSVNGLESLISKLNQEGM